MNDQEHNRDRDLKNVANGSTTFRLIPHPQDLVAS
jgi:hypothetical protein